MTSGVDGSDDDQAQPRRTISPQRDQIDGAAHLQRIGIFGGTFDPIHIGHLILAEEAWFQLKLDRVYLVPAGDPPHKQDRRLLPVDERVRMAELATADIDYIRVSRIDADRPGPHYAVDMVQLVQATHRQQRPNSTF